MTEKTTEPKTKKQILIDLLRRKNGASMADIMKATGWQAHSARAMISGLRKAGHEVECERTDKGARYRMAKVPA